MGEPKGCLFGWLLGGASGSTAGEASSRGAVRVDPRGPLLSAAELAFYRVITESVVGDDITVAMKVRLGDLFVVRSHDSAAAAMRNRINTRHCDFVLMETATGEPLAGIELDDASHRKRKAQDADRLKDEVFAMAGIPLVRVRAAARYDIGELRRVIQNHLNN